MKLNEAVKPKMADRKSSMSLLRKPIYAVGDAIHGLQAEIMSLMRIAGNPDKKLVELVRKLAKLDVDIHKYMNRNHKGWD